MSVNAAIVASASRNENRGRIETQSCPKVAHPAHRNRGHCKGGSGGVGRWGPLRSPCKPSLTSRRAWQLMRLSRLEGKSPLQEAPCQYILSANGNPRANRHTSMVHDPALRGRCYMLVSHICEIVAGRLYADCLVTVPCVLTPPTSIL